MAKRGTVTKRKTQQDMVVVPDDGMTPLQRLFVENYFICNLNGTEAALATFDTQDRVTAASMAYEYLRKPEIASRVDERLTEYHITANEILARIAFHARGSMEEFIDPDSNTIDLRKARAAKKLGLIKRFKTKFTTTTKTTGDGKKAITEEIEVLETEIELYDAQAALRDLGKHFGLWGDTSNTFNFNMLTDEQLEQLASGKKVDRVVSIEAGK